MKVQDFHLMLCCCFPLWILGTLNNLCKKIEANMTSLKRSKLKSIYNLFSILSEVRFNCKENLTFQIITNFPATSLNLEEHKCFGLHFALLGLQWVEMAVLVVQITTWKKSSGNICINKENKCQLYILLPETLLTKVDINIQDEKMNSECDFLPCGIPTSHLHFPPNPSCISSVSSQWSGGSQAW